MNLSLEGKIAIVTGGSKGIGKATALSLAHEGVDVVICARGITDLEDTAAEIRSTMTRHGSVREASYGAMAMLVRRPIWCRRRRSRR